MIPLDNQPPGYWATNLYKEPRKRPKADAPIKDLPPRAAQRFKLAREGIRAMKHVSEQVVFLGTAWKWVWMYEVSGRKLGYLHPMESSVSATFILTETEERELRGASDAPAVVQAAMRTGVVSAGVRWCWMDLSDLEAAAAFVAVIKLKHLLLSRPE
jgi:hypothetical protein